MTLTQLVLFSLAMSVLAHAFVRSRQGRMSESGFWVRLAVAMGLVVAPWFNAPTFDAQVVPVAAACAVIIHAVRMALRNRPLPHWHGGAHERIDNP